MKMLAKLMEKKQGKPMDPMYKDAKMSMLHELRDHMSGMMKDDLANAKGMKKVEVAGSDPSALAAGLDKAKELISGSEESPGHEAGESSEFESGEDEEESEPEDSASLIKELVDHEAAEGDLSPEKIDELINMLHQKKMEMGGMMSDAEKMAKGE